MMTLQYEVDVEQQLTGMKRLVAYLMARNGETRIRIPIAALDRIPDSAQILVWQDPAAFELVVAIHCVPPVDGIVDAEIIHAAPPTFHNEPHPELPGVVRPVLDAPIRMDPATGACEWEA